MNYQAQQIQLPKSDDSLELNSNLLHDVIIDLSRKVMKSRENQIIEVLRQNGYEFKDMQELEYFAKNRCEIICFDYNDRKILKVDGKPICEWWNTYRYENDGDKMTVICGEFISNL